MRPSGASHLPNCFITSARAAIIVVRLPCPIAFGCIDTWRSVRLKRPISIHRCSLIATCAYAAVFILHFVPITANGYIAVRIGFIDNNLWMTASSCLLRLCVLLRANCFLKQMPAWEPLKGIAPQQGKGKRTFSCQ